MSTDGGMDVPHPRGSIGGESKHKKEVRAQCGRWAYVEENNVQLPDEYDQIVSS